MRAALFFVLNFGIVRNSGTPCESRDALERDDFSSNCHPALAYCWSMIFPENRFPLFGIMLNVQDYTTKEG